MLKNIFNQHFSIEELYRTAPTNCMEQKDWWQWENQYLGKRVKEKGWFYSASIHPQEGKLFFIVTIGGKKDPNDRNTIQVAILIDDAHSLSLGDKEGSFLLDRGKWICLGETYAFEGRVHQFSRFDAELRNSEYGNLIILRTKLMDIEQE